MLQKQSWYKFKRLLGGRAPKRQGVVLLEHENKILTGSISHKLGAEKKFYFDDYADPLIDIEQSAEVYSHKYQADTVTVLSRDDLMTLLPSLTVIKRPHNLSYHHQLELIRELLQQKGVHKGDRSIASILPKNHFFLELFETMFAELLPERKIILLGVVDENRTMETLALEFEGRTLKKYSNPDWSGLEWTQKGMDVFHQDTVHRLTLWAENNYLLPCYSVFVSRRLWNECGDIQQHKGNKAAWKHFLQQLQQREAEKELVVDPLDWSMRANLKWHGLRA